jgi:zeaxanthin glucosyltransferase
LVLSDAFCRSSESDDRARSQTSVARTRDHLHRCSRRATVSSRGGFEVRPFCEDEYPVGSIAKNGAPISKLHGLEAARRSVEKNAGLLTAALRHLPKKLAQTGAEALVIDVIYTFLELVPLSLDMPYAQISTGLHLDASGTTPPFFYSWPHETNPAAVTRNREGAKTAGEIFAPMLPPAMSYADKAGLTIDWNDFTATASQLAVITQTPREFDFPGIPWPAAFHYTVRFRTITEESRLPFPGRNSMASRWCMHQWVRW